MEAMAGLGEKTVPALVVDTSREEQLLMGLVENIARRPPSNRDLIREVRELTQRSEQPTFKVYEPTSTGAKKFS
jgi:ParB family chromosome partitioning protein